MNNESNKICIFFDTPYVAYNKPPYSPTCIKCKFEHIRKHCNVFADGDRFYINGYEYKNGEWKRTLKALWHLLF
jgi:hypothetical protein